MGYRTIGGKKFELVPTEEEEESGGLGCGCLMVILGAVALWWFIIR